MDTVPDMNTKTTRTDADFAELREGMIVKLRDLNAIRTPAVEAAVRAVPRDLFIPEVEPEKAYKAEFSYTTKRDGDGLSLSSVSASRIQAFMLEQADIRPGMRVLEIGSGGYNAALMAELVGPQGEVTTIDIDPDVIDRASRLLDAAGYSRVHARTVDGSEGVADRAPFDRIVVTVETADLAPAWVAQLAPDGRIVAPLRLRGLTRSMAFQREDGALVARDFEVCGFVPMQGSAALDEAVVVLHDGEGEEVGLRLDGDTVNDGAMREGFAQPRTEAWSGITMGVGSSYATLELSLLSTLPRFALMAATRAARDRGLVSASSPMGVCASIEDDASFAYMTMRPVDEEKTLYEFGAVGHGPQAKGAAERMVEATQEWDRRGRDYLPELRAYPAGAADAQLPEGRVLDRPATRFTISWPAE
jgi:protein-L-isoaspartate(D-aspartate) O-methyltransferase